MAKNTLLITKLKTTNIGNQALSDEVIRLYETSSKPFSVTGRPEGLFGYSIEKLQKTSKPLDKFEQWADGLLSKLKPLSSQAVFEKESRRVELLSFSDFKVKNDGFFQRIKNIFRRYIHTEALFAKAYRKRFLKIAAADAIVYSGAGEVGDNNIFLRQLLELRIAQKMGKLTSAINQSVEVVESPMKEICAHVYKNMDSIIVRGTVSKSNMISIGVPEAKIKCYPDSAFLNSTPDKAAVSRMREKYSVQKPSVGINATKIAGDIGKWGEIIGLIKSLGYSVFFISNDPFGDKAIGERLASEFGITPILEFIHYSDYAALLANFEFVISCRLHTNELSLTGGTPIIPIEGSHFKTMEVFSLTQYPIPVTNAMNENWHEDIKKHIKALHSDPIIVKKFVNDLDTIRGLSRQNLVV